MAEALPSALASPLLPGAALWLAYGNRFYLPSTTRITASRCAPAKGNAGSPQGCFRGRMQSSQLFRRERLGPVTSARRKRYHLCKQVIPVCLPVLWMGELRSCFEAEFLLLFLCSRACGSVQGFLLVPPPASDFRALPSGAGCQDSGRVVKRWVVLHQSLAAEVCRPERLQAGFHTHALCPGHQKCRTRCFPLGNWPPEAQSGISVAKNVPGRLPRALLNPAGRAGAGSL